MAQYFELVKRNMKIYLRDRSAVFFSLLSMVIVLMLMLFFLGDMTIDNLTDILSELPDQDAKQNADNARMFVTLWTCGGIVSINAVTVTLAVYSSMIKDRTEGRLDSICTAPISRLTISAAYAAIMYLAAMLVKTQVAWSGIGTVIGTLVGFLGGIYIPVGSLAEEIQTVLKCMPLIYGTKMFRSVMTVEISSELFSNAPEALKTDYFDAMGVGLDFFGIQVGDTACVMILLICGMIFMTAGAFVTKYMANNNR